MNITHLFDYQSVNDTPVLFNGFSFTRCCHHWWIM